MDTITYEQWLAIGKPTQKKLFQESNDEDIVEEVLHVFKSAHSSRVESFDSEGNIIEAVYIEEHNDPDYIGAVIPDKLLTNPKNEQNRKQALGSDYVSTLGNVRTFNADLESANKDGSSRYIEMWSHLSDRPHPSQLMNLAYTFDVIQAFLNNPTMIICPNCNLQFNRFKLPICTNCNWNLDKF